MRRGVVASARQVFMGVVVVPLLVGFSPGCKKQEPITRETPAVVVREDSSEFLFTWIDPRGSFFVEQSVKAIPAESREAVRVLDPGREEGTHDERIFVADLRQPHPDGTYPVRTMTRADFDAIAVARRSVKGTTLANAATSPSPSPSPRPGGSPGPAQVKASPRVIVYGASWCGACHQAAAYFKNKGISFVEKDIEADSSAAREMRAKLAKAGLHTGSIPVLDVRGTILVGFDPGQVEQALSGGD